MNDTPKLVHRSTDFGLNPEIEEDRKMFLEITRDIIQNAAEKKVGSWRSQLGENIFYIKGENVVVVNNGTYVTTLKGGVRNERVKNARKL